MQDAATWGYVFEAKGIQKYILDSGRLADLIGGSDLVAQLCASSEQDMLAAVIAAARAPVDEARRAGGVFELTSRSPETLHDLRALWRLAVSLGAPGLEFADATTPHPTESADAALALARAEMSAARDNTAALLLPVGHPFVAFNPRTGRIATEMADNGKDAFSDLLNTPQRRRGAAIATGKTGERLAEAFVPQDSREEFLFPRHFETEEATDRNPAFPFPSADRRVAVLHADLSGLGEIYGGLHQKNASIAERRAVSLAIETAVTGAARAASTAVLCPKAMRATDGARFRSLFGERVAEGRAPPPDVAVVPGRPILLGGDDITILVRADLAFDFACHFLAEIERQTEAAFQPYASRFGLMSLTACAGIAIVAAGHPTLGAEVMAEGLCKRAKTLAKADRPYRSALAFAVVTSTIEESFASYLARELTTADRKELSHPAYFVASEGRTGVSLQRLAALARALHRVEGRGKLIESLGLRFDASPQAGTRWQRFWEYLGREDAEGCSDLRNALAACIAWNPAEPGPPPLDDCLPFLNDALELVDIGATRHWKATEA